MKVIERGSGCPMCRRKLISQDFLYIPQQPKKEEDEEKEEEEDEDIEEKEQEEDKNHLSTKEKRILIELENVLERNEKVIEFT